MDNAIQQTDQVSAECRDNQTLNISKANTSKSIRTTYDPAIKLEAVQAFVSDRMTRHEVVEHYGIASISTFKKWVLAYRRYGEAGLIGRTRGGAAGTRNHVPVAFNPLDPEAGRRLRRENQRLASKLGR
ncbi:MAG: transposase [Raoultibacter sp.]